MKIRRSNRGALAAAVACGLYGFTSAPTRGQTGPISLTSGGFNNNVVYTGSDTPSIGFDIFNNYDFYVSGFPGSSGYGYGFPTANNETFTSVTSAATPFQFQPYANNNVLLLTSGGYGGVANTGTLNFTSPGSYSSLAFLESDSNTASTISYSINYTNGTSQTGSFSSLDWYAGGTTVALNGVGRAGAGGAVDTGTGDTTPYLYEYDVAVNSTSLQVASVSFTMTTPGGNASAAGIFAISGTQLPLIYTGNALAGTWDFVSQNFNTPTGSPTVYSDGIAVQFVDNPTGGANINIPGTVSPFSVTFANNSSNYSLTGGPIAGTTGLSLKGTASVTLNSSNSYTGQTNVSAGTLILAQSGSIASSVVYIGSGAGLYMQTALPLTGNPAVTDNGTFNLSGATAAIASLSGTGALNIDGTSSLSLAGGSYTGSLNLLSGGSLTETGTGTIALGAINLYGTINVNSGTLQLSQTGSNFSGGKINVGSTAKLALVAGSTGQLVASDINNILADSSFSTGAVLSMNYSSTAATLPISGNFSGIGFTKLGAGTVILSGTDSIAGPLTVSAGTLVLSPSTTLSGNLSALAANTTLNLNGSSGTFPVFTGTAKGVLTNTSTTLSSLTVGTGGGSTFAANISGNIAITFASTGTIILSGSTNSYTGSTNISSGTLELNSANAASSASTYIFGGGQVLFESASKAIDLSSHTSTVANQQFNFNTGSQTITLATGLNSSGGNLVKLGSGTLNMSAVSLYTGYTNVSAGTLNFQVSNGLPSSTTVNVAGTLGLKTFNESVAGVNLISGSITGTTAVLTDATTFNLGTGTVSAGLAGTQGLLKSGTGLVTLNGSDTFTGAVNLSGGTLLFNSSGAFSTGITSLMFNGGTLEYSAGYTADSSAIFSTAPGQAYNFNTNGQTVSLATPLTSSGATLNKSGAGTLTIAGGNSYSGTTTLTAGTLKLGGSNAINPASALVFATGTLDMNGNSNTFSSLTGTGGSITNSNATTATITIPQPVGTSTFAGSIADGTGKIAAAFTGPGNQVLSGISGYSGGTTVQSGTVTVASNTALGSGPVALSSATLALALPGNLTHTVITGLAAGSGATQFQINNNGTAGGSQGISGGTLTLTDGNNNEALSAFTNAPVSLGTGFVASFVYSANSSGTPADGFSFCLQNDPRGASAVGMGGGDFAYAGPGAITNSAAVVFNIFPYVASMVDPGIVGESFQAYGLLNNNFNDVTGDVSGTGSLYEFGYESVNVTLTYNASSQTLTESLTNGSVDGGSYSNTYTGINLASLLGGTSAYVGFTGATGGSNSTQTISGFTFGTSNPGPASISNNISATAGTTNTIVLNVYTGYVAGGVGSLSIAAGARVTVTATSSDGIANHGVLTATGLSLAGNTNAWTGLLDLTNNSLDLQNGNLATVTNQIKQGYGNGNWQGSGGITSSAAAADSSHLTALGAILNTTDGVTPLYGSAAALGLFEGISPAATDVLVKFTYYGDTDLNGEVDGTDYSRIDNAFANNLVASSPQLTGWFNGDFNYDGVIDGSDYTLIDNAFNSQGAQISSEIAATTAQIAGAGAAGSGSAVPEPASVVVLWVAGTALLGRRRRRV